MFEHGFSFEQWVVTPADRVVSGPYGETKLEPRVMGVFVHLAENAGEVVSRNDLIDAVWGNVVVGDDVLSRCIYQIRRALAESSRDAHFLETVPKQGYRLNAPVVDLAEAERSASGGRWLRGSPFRGLHSFDVEFAPVFFGRAIATQEALAALRGQSEFGKTFLLLLGASGVGKSSLARAGILHNLIQPGAVPGVLRWRHGVFQPGDNPDGPFAALVDSLHRLAGEPPGGRRSVADALADGDADRIFASLDGDENAALVVDQFEEAFSAEQIDDVQRAQFFDALEALATCGRCWIIATMRADYYPHCSAYPALMRLKKGGGQYDVRPLRANELQQMIRLPAQAAGLAFERSPETGRTLDDALYEAAVAEPRLLPLLEFTLQALYDARTDSGELTWRAYRALGGIEGSLARRAEMVFAGLPPAQQAALPHVLSRLVRVSDGRVSKTSRSLAEFARPELHALIQAFVDARLFTTELGTADQPRVDIAHEALLTNWPRATDWIADNREMLLVHERVADAHARWQAEQRDDLLLPRGKSLEEAVKLEAAPGIELTPQERSFIGASAKRASRRRLLERSAVAVLAVLIVVAGSAAWLAGEQRDFAIEQSALAERRAETSRRTADFLVGIFDAADPQAAAGGEVTARRILDLGVARLEDELVDQGALRGRLRTSVARAYKGLGAYEEAERLLRKALEEAAGDVDLTARERLGIQFELADVLFQRGDVAESEELHDRVLEQRSDLFGEEDLDTVQSLYILAHKLWRDGDVGQAVDVFDQVLTVRREQLGSEHGDTVDVLTSLGTLHFMQGLRAEAAAYYREAAELTPAAYGERSVATAIAISNLAAVTDDPVEREVLLQRSLSIRREVLGDDHQLVARAQEILAKFYADQDDGARADELYRQSIATLVRGTELTLVRPTVRVHYGNFLQSRQRYDDALVQFETARDEYEQQLGVAHRHTGIAAANAAYTRYLQGDSDRAVRELRALLALRNPEDSADRFARAATERTLSEVLAATGALEEATRHAESAVSIFEADTERHRMALASTLAVLAEIALAKGDADTALTRSQTALQLAQGAAPLDIARYSALVGAAQAAAGDCDQGIDTLAGALSTMPATGAAERYRSRTSERLDDARSSCGEGSVVRASEPD